MLVPCWATIIRSLLVILKLRFRAVTFQPVASLCPSCYKGMPPHIGVLKESAVCPSQFGIPPKTHLHSSITSTSNVRLPLSNKVVRQLTWSYSYCPTRLSARCANTQRTTTSIRTAMTPEHTSSGHRSTGREKRPAQKDLMKDT